MILTGSSISRQFLRAVRNGMRSVEAHGCLCKACCRIWEPGRCLIAQNRMEWTPGKVHRPSEGDTSRKLLFGKGRQGGFAIYMRDGRHISFKWDWEAIFNGREVNAFVFQSVFSETLLCFWLCCVRYEKQSLDNGYKGPCIWSINWQTAYNSW